MSFSKAEKIIEQLKNNGYDAYIVGGVVRDLLLKKKLGDIDIATSALPEDVQRIFEKTIPVGIEHGTVIVRMDGESYEVTTFRKEGEYEDYRHPSEVEFHDSIELDLSRRDFTINAMALRQDETVFDPFGGQLDLEKKLIRAVGNPHERFREDPLRMMRALRFLSALGFRLESETYTALKMNAVLLDKISVERIRDEFEKLLAGAHCEEALQFIKEANLDRYLPNGPYKFEVNPAFSKWEKLTSDEERWAGFLLRLGISEPFDWLHAWKPSNQKRKQVSHLVELYRNDPDFKNPMTLYRNGLDRLKSVMRLQQFFGYQVSTTPQEMNAIFVQLPIQERSELAIDGNDLQALVNQPPGPWIEELLENIECRVVSGTLKNDPGEIKEWITQCNQAQENG
ncbi:CCA tRNA nucleotidyltransferase [Pseudalkalibacillus sp. Hm43]|uniref:CCA tRNA nucleotidyltransferase n=1 Tax=Pseudalkalibacillus sp. Hm43 TaxID=3450742 RepID=UPI003F440D46